jgi:hypothetical protein
MSERRILYVTGFIRAVTTSLVGVLLGVYLAKQDLFLWRAFRGARPPEEVSRAQAASTPR